MISVCVATYQAHPAPNLTSLSAALPAALDGEPGELCVALNGIDPLTAGVPADARVTQLPVNRGVAPGWNAAAALAVGDVLVFLNDDCDPGPGSLATLARLLRQNADAGVVGPSGANWSLVTGERDAFVPPGPEPTPCDVVEGYCFAVSRTVFDAVGGFDEFYAPASWEEVDFCTAVRAQGLTNLVVPGVPVAHEWGVSAEAPPWRSIEFDGRRELLWSIHRRNRAHLIAKWSGLERDGEARAVECLLCGAPSLPSAAWSPLPLASCTSCSFTFRPSLTDVAVTRDLYEGGIYEQTHATAGHDDPEAEERRSYARSRVRFVAEHVAPRGRLLDVGAAGGAFVLEAARAGFDASGIEPVPVFARHAREVLGVDVRDGRVEDIELEAADVITLWHVLEHLPDPVGGLEAIVHGLRPGGRLVVEVPNLQSIAAAQQGTAWTHLDVETHVSHFTPATLREALLAVGLTPLHELSVPHDVYLTPVERRAPRHLAARAKLAARAARDRRRKDPWRHEFLRVVAGRSAG